MAMLIDVLLWVGWNFFLAVIPIPAAYAMVGLMRQQAQGAARLAKAAGILLSGVAWLFFLPNAPYLLTGWRHFLHQLTGFNLYEIGRPTGDGATTVLLAIYTLFYLFYSAFGLLAFTVATRSVVRALKLRGAVLACAGIPFFLLMSLGVYLGLIPRFNSWELLSQPVFILQTALDAFTRPLLAVFIFAFAAFLWLAYWVVDTWIDGLLYCRLRRAHSSTCSQDRQDRITT
jgi:uncharacterized membrane protein